MSRLRFLYAVTAAVALLAATTALAACGGGSDRSGENPKTIVSEATLQGIESGNLDLSLGVTAEGQEGGNLDVSISGPFQGEGKGEIPQLDIDAKANGSVNGSDIDFEGGLVLQPNSAYINYKGTEYEVDPSTFSFVEPLLKPQQGKGGEGESVGCQEAAGGLKVGDFLEGGSNDGSADVDGTSTTKVSGDLNVAGALDALLDVAENPSCRSQLSAAGQELPSKAEIDEAKKEVNDSVKAAHVEIYVGDDNIVRRISAQLTIEPKKSGKGPKSTEIDVDMTLTEVNEEQEISAPSDAKPINDLFFKFGINPLELLGLLNGEGGGEVIGRVLEQIIDEAGGNSGGGGGGGQQAYLQCLQKASTAGDLQQCTQLL